MQGMLTKYIQPQFNRVAKEQQFDLIDGDRGAPENKGFDFKASQWVDPYTHTHRKKKKRKRRGRVDTHYSYI